MIFSGLLLGFGGSLIWIGQGKYITDWSVPENKGLYFGLFYWIYMSSQVIGNLISAFILDIFSQLVYFSIMSGFAIFGFISFLFLSIPLHQDINEPLKARQELELSEDFKAKDPLLNNSFRSKTPICNSENLIENQTSIKSTFKFFELSKWWR